MRTSVYLRTHYWDAATALCHAKAQEALGGALQVVADMTTPFEVPDGVPGLSFVRADFPAMGLPLRPSPDRAMWFNGDYVLALLARQDPADFLLMIDGDCLVNGLDLPALIRHLEALQADFCAPFVKPCGPGDWPDWRPLQQAWYDEELGPDHGVQVWKTFFPLVFMSRRAVLHLAERRREMAAAKRRGLKALWPQCESFAPSETARLPGAVVLSLEQVWPDHMHMTFFDPLGLEEVKGHGGKLIHPLLQGRRLGEKIVFAARERGRDLGPALRRPLDPEARAVIEAALAGSG